MTHSYQISGMHCESCTEKIRNALEAVPEISKVEVSLNPPRAVVTMTKHLSDEELNEQLKPIGTYSLSQVAQTTEISVDEEKNFFETYFPLILIASYLIGGVLLREFQLGRFSAHAMMANFMGGFFIIFSFFKLLDLKGFAEGYSTYDIIAQRWSTYGKVYPFIELLLGVLYLFYEDLFLVNLLTMVVMGVSSIGVIKSILAGRQIQCACLGTIFKLPLTNITVFEDLLMALMSLAMLLG